MFCDFENRFKTFLAKSHHKYKYSKLKLGGQRSVKFLYGINLSILKIKKINKF
jgi:hypothetical protein